MSSSSRTEFNFTTSANIQGKLRIYLGYAAGVGKTYQMLEEGRAIARKGVDVVVGYYEPHARPETAAQLSGLERVPLRIIEYRGAMFSEMDTEAILKRAPQLALIDEFPHTNVPGSERKKRWEDVLYLLSHGIDVWTTMNIQHLESLNDAVQAISDVKVHETVPDWVVQSAAEVIMVDLTPRALLNRLDRGVIYQREKAERAKQNFFKESTLVALREFALREAAFEVDARSDVPSGNSYSRPVENGKSQELSNRPTEKILILITPDPSTAGLIRRGKRVADYLKGECIAIVVCPDGQLHSLSASDRTALEKHLKFAQDLHIFHQILSGRDVAEKLSFFVHEKGITQVYLTRSRLRLWSSLFHKNLIQRIIELAGDVEITVVAERNRPSSNRRN